MLSLQNAMENVKMKKTRKKNKTSPGQTRQDVAAAARVTRKDDRLERGRKKRNEPRGWWVW
jgi:hypothetical protein